MMKQEHAKICQFNYAAIFLKLKNYALFKLMPIILKWSKNAT